jgi:hypothetical protein
MLKHTDSFAQGAEKADVHASDAFIAERNGGGISVD